VSIIDEIKRRIELKKQLIDLTYIEIKSLEKRLDKEIEKQEVR
jgi:hypothetical protein